jgi:hypothetical protein
MNLQSSDFDFITCDATRECMINGCWALDQTALWDWLRSYEVNPKDGFTFSSDKNIYTIGYKMESSDSPIPISHSGASFGITMRNLDYIAKNGFEAYKNLYISRHQVDSDQEIKITCGNK